MIRRILKVCLAVNAYLVTYVDLSEILIVLKQSHAKSKDSTSGLLCIADKIEKSIGFNALKQRLHFCLR